MASIRDTAKERLAALKKGVPKKPGTVKTADRAREREEVEELPEVGLRPAKKKKKR